MVCHKAIANANWNVSTCGIIEMLPFPAYDTLSPRYFSLAACPKQGIMQCIQVGNVRSMRNGMLALHTGSTHLGGHFIVKFYSAHHTFTHHLHTSTVQIYALTRDVSNKCNKILCHHL